MALDNVHAYLSRGDGPTGDHIDLLDPDGVFITIDGIDAPTPAPGELYREINLTVDIFGATVDEVWQKYNAIERLLGQARRLARPHSREHVTLGLQLNSSYMVYFDVLDGSLSVDGPGLALFNERVVAGALITLRARRYGRSAPLTFPVSDTLNNASGALITGWVPGTAPALTRIDVVDRSISGKHINRLRLGRKSGLYAENLYAALVDGQPAGEGSAQSGNNTLGGSFSRITSAATWQTIAGFSKPTAAPLTEGLIDVWARVRDGGLVSGRPTNLSAVPSPAANILQANDGQSSGSNHTTSWFQSPREGSLLALTVHVTGSTATITGPPGWSEIASVLDDNATATEDQRVAMYYLYNADEDELAPSYQTSAPADTYWTVVEYEGVATASDPLDVTDTGSSNPSGSLSTLSNQLPAAATQMDNEGGEGWTTASFIRNTNGFQSAEATYVADVVTQDNLAGSTAVSQDNAGGEGWNSPSNALSTTTSDAYASFFPNQTGVTDYLVISGFFGSNLPSHATIEGVTVKVRRRKDSGGTFTDQSVRIEYGGVLSDDDKADLLTPWTESLEEISYGGADDRWGFAALDPTNLTSLKVRFAAQRVDVLPSGGRYRACVNYVTVSVQYSLGETGVTDYLIGTFALTSIPDGAAINGITVTVNRRVVANPITDGDDFRDHTVQLEIGGQLSENKANTAVAYPVGTTKTATGTSVSYGGSSDRWGYASLVGSDINANNLRVRFAAEKDAPGHDSTQTLCVYFIQVSVSYFTAASLALETATRAQGTSLALAAFTASDAENPVGPFGASNSFGLVRSTLEINGSTNGGGGLYARVYQSGGTASTTLSASGGDHLVGIIAVFNLAETVAPDLPPGDYQIRITSLDDGQSTESPTSTAVYLTTLSTGAIRLSWSAPASGAVTGYRIYWVRNNNAYKYRDTGNTLTTYTLMSETGASTGDPPTVVDTVSTASFRLLIGLASGTVMKPLPGVSAEVANNKWELLYLGTVPLPPVPGVEGEDPPDWLLQVQGRHESLAVNLDVDHLLLLPHDEDHMSATYVDTDGDELTLSDSRTARLSTRRDGRSTALLLNTLSGAEAGHMEADGGLTFEPGYNLLIVNADTRGGENNIESTQFTVQITVYPRWLSFSASLT